MLKAMDIADKQIEAKAKLGEASGIVGEYQDALRLGYIPKDTTLSQFANERKPRAPVTNIFGGSSSDIQNQLGIQTTVSGLKYIDSTQFQGKEREAARQQAAKLGIPFIGKDESEALQNIDNARLNQQTIIDQITGLLPKDATGRILGGAIENKLSRYFQTSDQLGAFGSWRTAAINTLRATAGSKGLRINQAEIAAAVENDIPKITDTVGVAQQKFNNIKVLLDNAEKSMLVRNRSSLSTSAGTTQMEGPGGTFNVPNDKVETFRKNGYK
jgi:hypothetical protein